MSDIVNDPVDARDVKCYIQADAYRKDQERKSQANDQSNEKSKNNPQMAESAR